MQILQDFHHLSDLASTLEDLANSIVLTEVNYRRYSRSTRVLIWETSASISNKPACLKWRAGMVKVREHFILDDIPPPPLWIVQLSFKALITRTMIYVAPVVYAWTAPSNGLLVVNWINFWRHLSVAHWFKLNDGLGYSTFQTGSRKIK